MPPRKTTVRAPRLVQSDAVGVSVAEQVGQTVRIAIIMLGLVGIAWCARLIVSDLAGKITDANIAIDMLGKLEVSVALGWAVGIGGAIYGVSQNKLRKRTVKRLAGRVKTLEGMIDPGRSSSELGEDGDTNPEDV